MGMFKGFGLGIPHINIIETVEMAKAADQTQFEYLTIAEVPHDRSAMIKTAAMACNTKTIRLGIGVITPYIRQLSAIAADSMGLDELSNGRFELGLGVPIWKMKAYGYTVKNLQPLQTLKEATIILRDLMAGRPTSIESTFFKIPKNLKMGMPPVRKQIPIYFGVVNKLMLRLAGEISDFIELGACSHSAYAAWATKEVEKGATRGGRTLKDVPIHGHVLTCIDDDSDKARNHAKPMLAWYFGFLEDIMFQGIGMPDNTRDEIREIYKKEGVEGVIPMITDKTLDLIGAIGTPDEVIAGLKRYSGTGLTHPTIWGPIGIEPVTAIKKIAQEVLPAFNE